MFGKLEHINVCGIKAVVPNLKVDNLELFSEKIGEKKVKRQIKMTGVKERYIAPKGVTSDILCIKAAEELLCQLQWDKESINALIYVTETPRFLVPSTAFYIQNELGIGRDCVVYDINLGCSGWITGMQTVASIMSGIEKENGIVRALLLAGTICSGGEEKCTSGEGNEGMSMLFGDAGTVTALEYTQAGKDMFYMQKSDGSGYEYIMHEDEESPAKMNGVAIFDFTIDEVVKSVKDFTEHFAIDTNNIDYIVFHQAQKFILDNMVELLQYDESKVLTSFEHFGNASVAAIPLTLCLHSADIRKKKEISLLTAGFGSGLGYGALNLKMDTQNIMDISYL